MKQKRYVLGRNIVLYAALADFLIVTLHVFEYQLGIDFLLVGNILSHIVAPIFFIGIGLILYGFIVKKEYVGYQFSWWDLLALILILLTTQDYWYTIVTPHPLFHDTYGI